MTFTSIIKKNFQFNFNKFFSFFLVNTAVIALMIMYSSLIFNKNLKNIVDGQSIEKVILVGLAGLIVFCLVFITYTNIVFLKNRGKEFGMYLTLGMTTKELTKIVAFENFMVMIVSIISGVISGSLFGRLFYMGLNKVLQISDVKYELNLGCFVLSIGVFVIIFLVNILFNFIYLKRVSVIKILKAEKDKEISKERPIVVFIAFILFVVAMVVAPKILLSGKENLGFIIGIAIAITILAPYLLIGGGISFAKMIIKKRPSIYNNNILVISHLNHRFSSYKNMLYMLTILIAGALFFVGYSYSGYRGTETIVNEKFNFDLSFDTDNKFNKISKNETEIILKNNGANISNYYRIPYVNFAVIHKANSLYEYWSSRSTFISESAYNSYMDDKLNLEGNSAVYLHVNNEVVERKKYDEYILVNITAQKSEEINKFFEEKDDYSFNELEYKDILGSEFQISVDSYKEIGGVKFSNNQSAYVVSDELYNKMKKECNLEEYYINLINGKNLENGYNALKQELRIRNGFDSSYWSGNDLFREEDSYEKESAIPIYKEFEFDRMIKQNGMLYFILVFIGLLFLGANGIVLYYKVISDIDEEVERIKSLERIGTTTREIKKILSKEMAIIFFVPIFMGGIMGYYYLMLMSSNIGSTILKSVLVSGFLSVLFIGIIIQIIFYLISRQKYFKEIFRVK